MSFTDPGDILSSQNLVEVLQLLYSARTKWYNIGLVLGLNPHDLNSIRGEDDECLRRVLEMWLQMSESLQPTWQSLLEALRSEIVRHEHTAQEIEKYLKSQMETIDSTRQVCVVVLLFLVLLAGVILSVSVYSGPEEEDIKGTFDGE